MTVVEPAWTVVLSGPESKRAAVEVALEDAGIFPLPEDHHALMDWGTKLPFDAKKEKAHGWLTCQADDIDAPTASAAKHKWRLRIHYQTPPPPEPTTEQLLLAELQSLRAEVELLKTKAGQ